MGDGKSFPSFWPPPKRRKVSAVRDFPKGLKQIPKSTSDVAIGARDENLKASQSCGSENVKENKQYPEKFDLKSKGFKGPSEELGLKVKGDDDFGSNNAKKFKGSSRILDSKVKGGEAFGSKNVKDLKRCSEEIDPKVKCQEVGSSLNSLSLTGNMQRAFPKRRKVSAIRSFPPGLVRVMALKSIHTNTAMAEGTTNSLSAIGHGHRKPIVDEVAAIDNHLQMVEPSCLDIVGPSDGANMLESEYGINNGEAAAINDVQEPRYQLDGPDDTFLQAPNVAEFFSDDCHNGFLFEDDGEPSEVIADSGNDDQTLQVNGFTNEASKAGKLSILEKHREDVSPERFSSVGGSVSKDSPTSHGKDQIEEGGNRAGKVEYMPEKETPKLFRKCNTSPSGKVYKKAPMNCASEKIAGRDVVQGLMACKRCPWEHIVKRKPTL